MHTLSAIEIREQFVDGKITAVAIVRHFLERIEKYDVEVGAFLAVFAEEALAAAERLDLKRAEGKPLGKLAGIPIALKDNIHLKGCVTTCASLFLKNYVAPFDSTVARLILEEDGIIIGKTNMDEFAMGSSTENSALKKTCNPWNLACTPGGSSGGSAAAVAARMVPLALGSDTGGSIRQPAAFCGVVGFKPTYGRVSRYGLVAFASSLDQIGPFATNCRDAALLMEVIGCHCDKDSTSMNVAAEDYLTKMDGDAKGMKIGVPWHFLEDLGEEQKNIFESSIERFKELGAEIVSVDLDILKHSIAVYYILATAEASTNLARFDGIRYGVRSPDATTLEEVYDLSREDGFGSEVKRRILLGTFVLSSGHQSAYYKKAQKVRTMIIRSYQEIFSTCDFIAMPATPTAAFEIGAIKDPVQMYLADIYTIGVNLAGLPGVSVNSGMTTSGKPFGLQLIGAQRHDMEVLRVAYALEKASDNHLLMPSLIH